VLQTAIGFTSDKLSLEGILTAPQEAAGPFPALLVCHPHPALGGNMEDPVVVALCRAGDRHGMSTLRFNFRGVGKSEGRFSNGQGEQEDVKAALNVLRRWPGLDRKRLALVGYSFGASVVLAGLRRYKAARCLVLIAPPVSSVQSSSVRKDRRPKLFIAGERDRIAPSAEIQRALDGVQPPVQFYEVPAADHSLRGRSHAVADRAVSFALESLGVSR